MKTVIIYVNISRKIKFLYSHDYVKRPVRFPQLANNHVRVVQAWSGFIGAKGVRRIKRV